MRLGVLGDSKTTHDNVKLQKYAHMFYTNRICYFDFFTSDKLTLPQGGTIGIDFLWVHEILLAFKEQSKPTSYPHVVHNLLCYPLPRHVSKTNCDCSQRVECRVGGPIYFFQIDLWRVAMTAIAVVYVLVDPTHFQFQLILSVRREPR